MPRLQPIANPRVNAASRCQRREPPREFDTPTAGDTHLRASRPSIAGAAPGWQRTNFAITAPVPCQLRSMTIGSFSIGRASRCVTWIAGSSRTAHPLARARRTKSTSSPPPKGAPTPSCTSKPPNSMAVARRNDMFAEVPTSLANPEGAVSVIAVGRVEAWTNSLVGSWGAGLTSPWTIPTDGCVAKLRTICSSQSGAGRQSSPVTAIRSATLLAAPTWLVVRIARESDRLPSGVLVPVGCKIYLSPYVSHRRCAAFAQPETFDPDRFLPDRPVDPFSYFPFGAGARSCLGEGLARGIGTAFLIAMTRRVTLVPIGGRAPRAIGGLTLRPARPVRIAGLPRPR